MNFSWIWSPESCRKNVQRESLWINAGNKRNRTDLSHFAVSMNTTLISMNLSVCMYSEKFSNLIEDICLGKNSQQFGNSAVWKVDGACKVIHPKYYKHWKEDSKNSHLGR